MQVGTLVALGAITQTATSSLQIATGSTAQRPTGAAGKMRYNTDLERFEFFLAGAVADWKAIGLGDGTVTSVTLSTSSTGLSIANATVTGSGTISLSLAGEIAALNALSTTGLVARTGAASYSPRTIAADATAGKQGLTVANGDGVSGSPTLGLSISGLTAASSASTTDQIVVYNGTNNVRASIAQVGAALATTFSRTYRTTFTGASLSAGILTVTHNLGQDIVDVTLVDNNKKKFQPDDITFTSTSALAVDLTSFGALTGTWSVLVVG